MTLYGFFDLIRFYKTLLRAIGPIHIVATGFNPWMIGKRTTGVPSARPIFGDKSRYVHFA
jgi:hypothetical protein